MKHRWFCFFFKVVNYSVLYNCGYVMLYHIRRFQDEIHTVLTRESNLLLMCQLISLKAVGIKDTDLNNFGNE